MENASERKKGEEAVEGTKKWEREGKEEKEVEIRFVGHFSSTTEQ